MTHRYQNDLFDQPQAQPQPKTQGDPQDAVRLLSSLRVGRTKTPTYRRGMSIQQRFNLFHRENPHVYQAIRTLALSMKRKGHATWSIKAIFEILRWSYAMTTTDQDFKLPNDYHSRYARLVMDQEPELEGFFETRELRAA